MCVPGPSLGSQVAAKWSKLATCAAGSSGPIKAKKFGSGRSRRLPKSCCGSRNGDMDPTLWRESECREHSKENEVIHFNTARRGHHGLERQVECKAMIRIPEERVEGKPPLVMSMRFNRGKNSMWFGSMCKGTSVSRGEWTWFLRNIWEQRVSFKW